MRRIIPDAIRTGGDDGRAVLSTCDLAGWRIAVVQAGRGRNTPGDGLGGAGLLDVPDVLPRLAISGLCRRRAPDRRDRLQARQPRQRLSRLASICRDMRTSPPWRPDHALHATARFPPHAFFRNSVRSTRPLTLSVRPSISAASSVRWIV